MTTDFQGCGEAMRVLQEALQAVFAAAYEGMRPEQVDEILHTCLQAKGVEFLPSPSSPFMVSEDGAPPKLRVDRVPLSQGLWGLDCTVQWNGYHADLGRYGYIGNVPEALTREHQLVLERQETIASMVQPGRDVMKIFDLCPQDLPFEVHRIGAGPSMMPLCGNATPGVLEAMKRSQREGLVYEPEMVLCVEVWAGLRGGVEDMYVMRSDGLVRMTTLPREIRVIGKDKT